MKRIKENLSFFLSEEKGKETLFFISYILFLIRGVMVTTMIPMPTIVGVACVLLSVVFLLAKILLYDGYHLKAFGILIAAVLGLFVVLLHGRYVLTLFWVFFIVGSKGISFRKILKVYCVVTGAIMTTAFIFSLLGIIENLQYVSKSAGTRNSFGAIYPTDFASHIFFIILCFAYLMGERLKKYQYCLFLLAGVLTFRFCRTRLDSSCIILTVALFGIGNLLVKQEKSVRLANIWKCSWKRLGAFVMPLLAVFSIAITYLYQDANSILKMIDKIFSSRLSLGKKGLETYGLKLWGQIVEMNGNGGTTTLMKEYFFIDCSYVLVLLRYGLIFLIALLLVHIVCCKKRKEDLYFQYAIALIAVNCVVSHHIIDFAYNPFALALLASFDEAFSGEYHDPYLRLFKKV